MDEPEIECWESLGEVELNEFGFASASSPRSPTHTTHDEKGRDKTRDSASASHLTSDLSSWPSTWPPFSELRRTSELPSPPLSTLKFRNFVKSHSHLKILKKNMYT
jgi:hypothetical protein